MFLHPGSSAPDEGTFDTELTTSRTPLQRMLQFLLNGYALVQKQLQNQNRSLARSGRFIAWPKHPCACVRMRGRPTYARARCTGRGLRIYIKLSPPVGFRILSRRKDWFKSYYNGQCLVPTTLTSSDPFHWGQSALPPLYINWLMEDCNVMLTKQLLHTVLPP